MILHKANCNGALTHRRQYLTPLNRAYGEQFEDLDQYKHEDNFKRVLSKLSLDDVRMAIQRAKIIMQRNQESGCIPMQYKGYSYYRENPSISLWEIIQKILSDCKLL